jgi:hypothetical protein
MLREDEVLEAVDEAVVIEVEEDLAAEDEEGAYKVYRRAQRTRG